MFRYVVSFDENSSDGPAPDKWALMAKLPGINRVVSIFPGTFIILSDLELGKGEV